MKISAVEIGTNSTKFIVAEVLEGNELKVLERTSTVNRLSKNMYGSNYISAEAFEKGIKIVGRYIERSRDYGASLVSVFSTSVLRDAANSADFSRKVKELYGVSVDIISGEREASLAFKACSRLVDNPDETFAVFDIGGGSTEITLGTGKEISRKLSIGIGAVRLTETFVKSDPASTEELENMMGYIENRLDEAGITGFKGVRLIGTGGTLKTAGTVYKNIGYKNEKEVNGLYISLMDIEKIYSLMSRMSNEEKMGLPGLNPKRADVITAGMAILVSVLHKSGAAGITVSSNGVIEGFVEDYVQKCVAR
jgi:exopolyphosphatase/guanosine-5'-triphosphate,3'-diphosphate pyrophosphatase